MKNVLIATILVGGMIFPMEGIRAAHAAVERLDAGDIQTLWSAVNSRLERGEVDGKPVLRWFLEPGQTGELLLKNPLFGRLRYYDRLEFEFRIASGQLDNLELWAQGHVSGSRRYKVHQWGLAILTTRPGIWHQRQIDLARPSWLPWDKADGQEDHFFLSALSVAPETAIEIRGMRLMAVPVDVKPFFEQPVTWPVRSDGDDGSIVYTLKTQVLNTGEHPATIRTTLESKHEKFDVSIEPQEVKVPYGGRAEFTIRARMAPENIASSPELFSETIRVGFHTDENPDAVSTFEMPVTRPLSKGLRKQFIIPEAEWTYLREKLASGDQELRKAIQADDIIAAADKFLKIRLDHIPKSRSHPSNKWPVVPGTKPERRYEIGEFMPEVVNPVTGEREAGTVLADNTWKEYLGNSGQITEKLGLAYALTGDEKYAAKAVELMELYAAEYGDLDLKWAFDPPWGGAPPLLAAARTAAGSTYGTNWLFRHHMRMLGLINDSASLTPEARKRIYEGFVLPYATELAKFPGGISNMTDITNGNLLILGLVFDDANLVRWALDTDPGLMRRLDDIGEDGFSSEGRPLNYHLAAMNEYLPAIGYALNSGLKIGAPKERLLAALRMPYQRATLGGVVPNAGDCGRGGFRVGPSAQADQIAPVFPEETWLRDIGPGATMVSKVRNHMTGHQPNPEGYRPLLESSPRLFRDAGFAILRSGDTPETQIMATLDYGRNPMHAHRDRNQITLSAFGKIFTHGPGTLYNVGSGGIVRVEDPRLESFCGAGSLGQNIVLTDARDQLPAIGELLAWSDDPTNQFAVSRVDGVAPGVSHTRSLILRDGLVVIFDQMESDAEHVFDFVYHNFGELALGEGWTAQAEQKPLAETANYPNISDLQRLTGKGPVHLTWNLANQISQSALAPEPQQPLSLALWQLPMEKSEVFTGVTGLNNPNTTRIPDAAPTLITRARGKGASFVTVLEPYKDKPAVTGIEGDGDRILIHRGTKQTEIRREDLLQKTPPTP